MSLVDGGNMYMPVAPAATSYGAGGGSMWGDSLFWIIVLFLFGFMGGGFGGGYGAGNGVVPFMMNNNNDVQRGFDQQAIMTGIGALQAGQNAMAQNQCQQFAGVNQNIFNTAAAAEANAAARQMAGMQQNWAMQTDIGNRLDSIQLTQQQGVYENRAAIADVKYAIAQDGAQTRANTDTKTQAIMDKLCQMELDNLKANYENKIATITQNYENRMAGMQAQINDQQIQINNASRDVALANEVDALYNRLNSCPVPTTPVYGRTPIFTCSQNPNGCTCNSNGIVQMAG